MFENIQDQPSPFTRFFRSLQFKLLAVLLLLGAVVAVIAVGLWGSPYFAIWNMKRAAQNRDAATFCAYIDFPLLRDNLKAELNAKMLFEMNKDEKLKGNPFSGLAALAGPAMINNMIDGYVTPAAIERAFKEEAKPKDQNLATETFNKDFLTREDMSVSTNYDSFSEFHVVIGEPNQKRSILVFERRTLIDWQLVGMKLD